MFFIRPHTASSNSHNHAFNTYFCYIFIDIASYAC